MITTTSSIFPFKSTGLRIAPVPPEGSSTLSSGIESYSDPLFSTWISTILPLEIIGASWEFFPLLIETLGFVCKLNMVDPYPVPDSYR